MEGFQALSWLPGATGQSAGGLGRARCPVGSCAVRGAAGRGVRGLAPGDVALESNASPKLEHDPKADFLASLQRAL